MGIKYKDPTTGQLKELSVKAADTLPIGSIVDYDGDVVPDGWEEVEDENDLIQCSITSTYTSTFNPEEKIPLDRVLSQIGNNLELKNGGVTIGKGINNIMIKADISEYIPNASTSKAYTRIRVLKNGSIVNNVTFRSDGMLNRPYVGINGYIVSVKEGDEITFGFYHNITGLSGNLEYTGVSITVEKIN